MFLPKLPGLDLYLLSIMSLGRPHPATPLKRGTRRPNRGRSLAADQKSAGYPMEYANLFVAYRAVCQEHADRTLFRIQQISFGETWKRVEARSLFITRQGFRKGDVLAILGPSSPEWCLAYMAITAIGAIALPLDTNLSAETYREMLGSTGAKALFAAEPFRGLLAGMTVFPLEAEPPAAAGETASEPEVALGTSPRSSSRPGPPGFRRSSRSPTATSSMWPRSAPNSNCAARTRKIGMTARLKGVRDLFPSPRSRRVPFSP